MDLTTGLFALLIVCVLAVCFFEFVNGFHDTANAVATVIYTHSLKPTQAVVLSGLLNFLGVIVGGLGVAMSLLKLIPLTALMNEDIMHNVAFLLAVLISAIAWNLGTWYWGIPASSSHTLIGALIGASLVFSSVSDEQISKAYEVFMFLLITPIAGFVFSLGLLGLMRKFIKSRDLYDKPEGENPPPMWIRLLMIFGCAGVSFNHGANDGQKGVGLLMVVLMAFLPTYYALTPDFDKNECMADMNKIEQYLVAAPAGNALASDILELKKDVEMTKTILASYNPETAKMEKKDLRNLLRNEIPKRTKRIVKDDEALEMEKKVAVWSAADRKSLKKTANDLTKYTDHAPTWTVLLISLCLGIGTMIGWKRIVETIGEKIGKSGFDYSQGFVSQVVSAGTIGLSTFFKLPVSTTHIVSSSVMGTMFAKGGKDNIQRKTVVNIFMAWVLTLPVAIGLSAGLYWIFKLILT